MTKPKIHLLGLSHTIPSLEYSHCAFTGRVRNFAKMMHMADPSWRVIEYSNEGSESEADEHVVMLSQKGFDDYPHYPEVKGNLNSAIHQAFSARLKGEITKRFRPGDIVAHPFGIAHKDLKALDGFHVEIGIGYNETWALYRVYESFAWMHYHQGKEQRGGNDYEFVCPMGYNVDEWPTIEDPAGDEKGQYFLYFGRIVHDKGLDIIREIAKNSDHRIILCGEGDPSPWLDPSIPNLEYKPPMYGLERAALLGNARAMLMPTRYVEPFGGAGVEGLLCGTPLIASDFGAFTETVIHDLNGYRCKTLGDWIHAMDTLNYLEASRRYISSSARWLYGLEKVGQQMDKIFRQIIELKGQGWYSKRLADAVWQ